MSTHVTEGDAKTCHTHDRDNVHERIEQSQSQHGNRRRVSRFHGVLSLDVARFLRGLKAKRARKTSTVQIKAFHYTGNIMRLTFCNLPQTWHHCGAGKESTNSKFHVIHGACNDKT